MDWMKHIDRIDESKNFKNFSAGKENEEATAAAEQFAEKDGGVIYIYGPKESDRNHLMQAVVNKKSNNISRGKIEITTGKDFGEDFLYAVYTQNVPEIHTYFQQFDVIVFEEMDGLSDLSIIMKNMLEMVSSLEKNGKTVMMTGCRPLEELFMEHFSVVDFNFPCTVLKLSTEEHMPKEYFE